MLGGTKDNKSSAYETLKPLQDFFFLLPQRRLANKHLSELGIDFQLQLKYTKLFVVLIGFDLSKFQVNGRFEIRLSPNYPLAAPRLYLTLEQPLKIRFDDSRDLLREALGTEWTHKNNLSDIVKGLPQLAKKIQQVQTKTSLAPFIGDFRLGDSFYFGQLQGYKGLRVHSLTSQKHQYCLVAVTDNHLLLFESEDDAGSKLISSKTLLNSKQNSAYSRVYRLKLLADIDCVSQLQHNKGTEECQFSLTKFTADQPAIFKKQLSGSNSPKLISEIMLSKIKMGPTYIRLELSQIDKKLRAKLQQAQKLEKQLDLTKDNHSPGSQLVVQLNKVFQQLIEYFSSKNSPYYMVYGQKLNSLNKKYIAVSARNPERMSLPDQANVNMATWERTSS